MKVLGIGGGPQPGSTTEVALSTALESSRRAGAGIDRITGPQLRLPFYDPGDPERVPEARQLVEAVAEADGLIIASPGYHGTVSGLVKNALDYIEDLRDAEPCYLEGRAVGCIAVAQGWQAAVMTMCALRDIAHALRGWPTPYGAAVNRSQEPFANGACVDEAVSEQLALVGDQVVAFAGRPAECS
ncbi:NADPH-dependent oxidoreductase [Egibacter rhizosphaerae]|uniref:NADPH-dependent oxidoreductase n=1 Tax=Egibacter rhizosphaerae TaxID=1670831 RepID=A0A411YGL0_9ACTN|nr:NAD(P)H-dependent oxidoreductase [Egibacter rhizosphaerae]QBI20380.1 NADPH-dependent oxidoreductase [Egibacter rhizosphaerae]